MNEHQPQPERPSLTAEQEAALRGICGRYKVGYDQDHYQPRFDLPQGWVAGWVGGYAIQAERPTIYIGASPEGELHS